MSAVRYDWGAIQAMWEAGESASSISEKEGMPSKQAICNHANDEGWTKIDNPGPELAVIPFDGLSYEQQVAVTKIAEGLPHKDAAALAGVHATTISRWLKEDENFAKARAVAVAVKTQRRLNKVESAEDHKAAIWLLERDKDTREDFGAPKPVMPMISGPTFNVLGQIQVGIGRIESEPIPAIEAQVIESA